MHTLEEEEQADAFARSFLMPEKKFREVCEDYYECYDGSYDINAIAEYFKVPILQVKIRARELGIFRYR